MIALGLTTPKAFAQEHGTWRLVTGELVSRPCLKIEKYGEVTPIPGGCRSLIEGGAVLYTRLADAGVSEDLKACGRKVVRQKKAIADLGLTIDNLRTLHEKEVASLAKSCTRCADELERRPTYSTLIATAASSFLVGAVLASLFMAAL